MHEQVGIQDSIRITPFPVSPHCFLLKWDYSKSDVYPVEERTVERVSEGTMYSDGCVHIHVPEYNFDTVEQMQQYFELRGKCEIEWLD
jgi:hypothetical protein